MLRQLDCSILAQHAFEFPGRVHSANSVPEVVYLFELVGSIQLQDSVVSGMYLVEWPNGFHIQKNSDPCSYVGGYCRDVLTTEEATTPKTTLQPNVRVSIKPMIYSVLLKILTPSEKSCLNGARARCGVNIWLL